MGVSRPIGRMTVVMRRLAQQDTSVEIFGCHRGDEIGAMAEAVHVFKDNMLQRDELALSRSGEQAVKERQAQRLTALVTQFEAKLASTVATLATAAQGLTVTAQSMSASAVQTTQQASTVAGGVGGGQFRGPDRGGGSRAADCLDRRDHPPGDAVGPHRGAGDRGRSARGRDRPCPGGGGAEDWPGGRSDCRLSPNGPTCWR